MFYILGCSNSMTVNAGWSSPVIFSRTDGGFGVTLVAHKWNNTILVLRYNGAVGADGDFEGWYLDRDGSTWRTGRLTGLSGFYPAPQIADPETDRLVFLSDKRSETNVTFKIRTIAMAQGFQVKASWDHDFTVLPQLSSSETVYSAGSAGGVSRGSEYYLPYGIQTESHQGNAYDSSGPSTIGVFHSSDRGGSWTRDGDFRRQTSWLTLGALEHTVLYLGYNAYSGIGELWSSQQALTGDSSSSQVLTTMCPEGFTRANTEDAIHVCWTDSRNEGDYPDRYIRFWRYLFTGTKRKNYQVFHSRFTDGTHAWSQQTTVSKDLLFAYHPAISAEGRKVVIAWSGAMHAVHEYHSEYSPNDIYCATSDDNGQTWSAPARVTDNTARGVTAGYAQVVLIHNVIHLFYIQGKYQENPVESGVRLIKQSPWDVIYQHRDFPTS